MIPRAIGREDRVEPGQERPGEVPERLRLGVSLGPPEDLDGQAGARVVRPWLLRLVIGSVGPSVRRAFPKM